ncbi:MAG: hypothetical protein AAGH79_11280 [Bacteroidota bacterium]
MYKYILEGAGNINWMALFALITFFTVFSLVLFMMFRQDKSFTQRMASLPLEDGNTGVTDDPTL